MDAAAIADLLKLIGSTSPLAALLVWHIWNQRQDLKSIAADQKESLEKFGVKVDGLLNAIHENDKRLAVIESFIETHPLLKNP